MNKSSKIWKIVKRGHIADDGQSCYYVAFKRIVDSEQLVYDSVMDCVLDIVTDEVNHGLKVYKHQERVETIRDENSKILVYPMKKVIGEGSKWDVPETMRKYVYQDSLGAALVDGWSNDGDPIESHTYTEYHWVEVFMQ
jgi:hypothetical protein